MEYKNWQLDIKDNVAWLYLDKENASVNTLNADILEELDKILDNLGGVKSLVLQSAKPSFIAGADINQFTKMHDAQEAIDLIRKAQLIFDKLENLSCPSIAVVKGFCLGGGYELALACTYIIAEEKSKIGLPEVKLGIHPGWGGTIRLPLRTGTLEAMNLILSGRVLSAKDAKKKGVVDEALPERHIESAILAYTEKKKIVRNPGYLHKIVNFDIFRPLVAKFFNYNLNKKIRKEHYPAPFRVVDNWLDFGLGSEAYLEEAKSIGRLIVTNTAQNLVKVFFLQENLKKEGKKAKADIHSVHVIGAGVMGGEIAAWCALKGFEVTLQDINLQQLGRAKKDAVKLFKKKLKLPHLMNEASDRFTLDMKGFGIKSADVIIEAVTENLDIKKKIFADIEKNMKKGALVATNTSTIPLEMIAENTNLKSQLVGIHFFNPVSMMPLVEVISSDNTDKKLVEIAIAFVGKIDKLPLLVKSSPGFLVNRVLMPYLIESMMMLEEGVKAEVIDQASLDFGMPMGPIELADTVGIDVCLHAAKSLQEHLGGVIPSKVQKMVDEGKLGKKSGKGFYNYKNGKLQKAKVSEHYPQDIQDRLIFRMLNESVACIDENIVSDYESLDGGMIFGAGFAPFLGGPINYVKSLGKDHCVNKLNQLKNKYGERFQLNKGWQDLSV